MTKGRPSTYATWLERQARPQRDGTYLIRVSFRLVFEIDGAAKARWVRFQVAYRRFAVIVTAILILTLQVRSWPRSWDLVALAAILLPVQYGGLFIVLRGAKWVSRDRWQGPGVIDRFGKHSRRFYLIMTIVSLLMDALFVWSAWAQWHKLDAAALYQYAGVVALFSSCAALMLVGYRRMTAKVDSLE
jgi:hypothetical protein